MNAALKTSHPNSAQPETPVQKGLFPAEVSELLAKGAGFVPLSREIALNSPRARAESEALAVAFLKAQSRTDNLGFFRNSVAQDKRDRPFLPATSLLALHPIEKLRCVEGRTQISNLEQGENFQLPGDPFSILAQRLERYRVPVTPAAPAVAGSALGYFAYDAVRLLEPRLLRAPGNLSMPSTTPDAEFFFFRDFFSFDHSDLSVTVMTGFAVGDGGNFERMQAAQTRLNELCAQFETFVAEFERTSTPTAVPLAASDEIPFEQFRPTLGREKFISGVQKLLGDIGQGEIFQAVLAEKLRLPFDGAALDLFETLLEISSSPYDFFLAIEGSALLGSSPEMLVRAERRELESHPIAGTRPRGKDAADDAQIAAGLLADTKEKAEHLMLVDLARNDLGRVAEPGSVRVASFMEIQNFSAVMHLVSKVRGRLRNGVSSARALAASFPAGTLSGAPKVRAIELLSAIEPERRGFYGGAVVHASYNGDLDSCIAIRSAQITDGEITIQAGAGVVADSQPESEYQEVQHKTRTLRRALGLYQRRRVRS